MTPILKRQVHAAINQGPRKATGARGVLPFVDDGENYDTTKEYERLSLDDFYASLADFKLTDTDALAYITFAAKLSCLRFKSQEEMLAFKGDFQAALSFIGKLDDVDVKGVEPLGNVFEYYKGNEIKMRKAEDFEHTEDMNFTQKTFAMVNVHAKKDGTYSVLPMTKAVNPDGE